ncbi:MAG: hypothetical protein BMS9Abin05_1074 [Rhodothermia bacterium]|nr:MAG: hypothetical protein BMS9Abin05_1074 [Rhodothermia bacterium]
MVASVLGSVVAILAFSSCDSTDLDPFDNNEKYFTVFGFLNERERDHAIRVIPLSRLAERIDSPSDPQASIDAVVTTTDLTTGTGVRWNHSLTRLTDGSFGHVYRASFIVRPGRTYRLEIARNDGKITSAETDVPNLSSTRVEQLLPVIRPDSSVYQDLILPGINSPWDVEVAYWFPQSGGPIRIPYGRMGIATDDGGWMIRVDFTRDMETLSVIRQQAVENLTWDAMGVRLQVLDEEWDPPMDIFDPEVLSIPGTLSNVEKGYGFFGSVGLFQDDWPNSAELDEALGF